MYYNSTDMAYLGHCVMTAFKEHINGSFFASVHNEMHDRWDYLRAYRLGWLNTTVVDPTLGKASEERPGALEINLMQ